MIPRWLLVRLVSTLSAWLVAFLTVMALLTLLDDELKSLPLSLRALTISGVLVLLMANLVMPLVNRVVMSWLAGTTQERPTGPATAYLSGRREP
jgi:antibiotic biosynthesis monooxygenase (ABM) superfamily enzyme